LSTSAVVAADVDILDGLVADAGTSECSTVVAVVDFAAGGGLRAGFYKMSGLALWSNVEHHEK
jgi:hypothetical protein